MPAIISFVHDENMMKLVSSVAVILNQPSHEASYSHLPCWFLESVKTNVTIIPTMHPKIEMTGKKTETETHICHGKNSWVSGEDVAKSCKINPWN